MCHECVAAVLYLLVQKGLKTGEVLTEVVWPLRSLEARECSKPSFRRDPARWMGYGTLARFNALELNCFAL